MQFPSDSSSTRPALGECGLSVILRAGPVTTGTHLVGQLQHSNTGQTKSCRYNEFAAAEHDRIHSGPRGGRLINGQIIQDQAPKNPFREKATR